MQDEQIAELTWEEWAKRLETRTYECGECAEEVTGYVCAYVQGSLYECPFDAIFYAGKCSHCGAVTEYPGQIEVDDDNALYLREKWAFPLKVLNAVDLYRSSWREKLAAYTEPSPDASNTADDDNPFPTPEMNCSICGAELQIDPEDGVSVVCPVHGGNWSPMFFSSHAEASHRDRRHYGRGVANQSHG